MHISVKVAGNDAGRMLAMGRKIMSRIPVLGQSVGACVMARVATVYVKCSSNDQTSPGVGQKTPQFSLNDP